MAIDYRRLKRLLLYYEREYSKGWDDFKFFNAICYVQLGNFAKARRLFEISFTAMFSPPLFWRDSGQPHWLVDVCVLSGRKNRYADVIDELEAYKLNPPGSPSAAISYAALYAYSVIELLAPSGTDIGGLIEGLLKRPKSEDGYGMGQTLRAIIRNDQPALDEGLGNLLKAHEGMAKRGGMRKTAEGFLCLPAMTLAYMALQRNLKVELENDYLSLGYLQFLAGYPEP
jgi:hypothetical protein